MSWGTGIIILGVVCFFLGYIPTIIKHYALKIIFILVTPFLMSNLLYWGLVWAWGIKDKSEFSSWSGVFIYPWAIAGLLGMLLGYILFVRYTRSNGKNG